MAFLKSPRLMILEASKFAQIYKRNPHVRAVKSKADYYIITHFL